MLSYPVLQGWAVPRKMAQHYPPEGQKYYCDIYSWMDLSLMKPCHIYQPSLYGICWCTWPKYNSMCWHYPGMHLGRYLLRSPWACEHWCTTHIAQHTAIQPISTILWRASVVNTPLLPPMLPLGLGPCTLLTHCWTDAREKRFAKWHEKDTGCLETHL